ncbi:MAG: 50S ribosomal protein L7/L12, partial [Patescibacteria group bacterium]
MITMIESLSALELAELVKALEERFGVSAAAPMMMAGAMPAA